MLLICAMPKTGTSSIIEAYRMQGYNAYHVRWKDLAALTQRDRVDFLMQFDVVAEWYGFVDFSKMIEATNHRIIVEREKSSWHESCEKWFRPSANPIVRDARKIRFGCTSYNSERFDAFYNRYKAAEQTLNNPRISFPPCWSKLGLRSNEPFPHLKGPR